MSKLLTPSAGLLAKLGSIAVHVDEVLSPFGHSFDLEAVKPLIADPEVQAWLRGMTELALMPEKRNKP